MREVFPPERAPSGRAPVGVSPFNCNTCSDSSLHTTNVKIGPLKYCIALPKY